jgi:molybdate transport system ATP-binding protein
MRAILAVPGRLQVDFACEPGEVIAVIGPNGSGKTTLVHALAGLVETAGSIDLDGEQLGRSARDREVGLVFQEQLLFPHLSALANVAFGPRARGVPRAEAESRARGWLERFGIGELAGRRPGQLSGGQAQRVAIARALATRPRLLLLDEPMSGLDVKVATALRIELSHHLASYDGIALLVTHDAIDALTIADRVLVLDAGRIAQYGTPAEVSQRPRTEHVARLVGLNVVSVDGDELMAFTPDAVNVSLDVPVGSPRLRWHGAVADVSPHGGAVRVLVRADPDLIADVTPEAATELGLTPGRDVWLSVKATAVRRYRAAGDEPETP